MVKPNLLIIVVLGLLSLVLFFLSAYYFPVLPAAIDDFLNHIYYIIARNALPKQLDNVIVIAIDDGSLRKIQTSWPLKRSFYAQCLNILNREEARVVGFDMVLSGEGTSREDDETLIRALGDFKGKVVLAYYFDEQTKPVYPKQDFRDNALTGFINVPSSRHDGIVREMRPYRRVEDFSDISFATRIASVFKGVPVRIKDGSLFLGDTEFALKLKSPQEGIIDGIAPINYLFQPEDIRTISFYDVLVQNFPKGLFKDKIVMIGTTTKLPHDFQYTPLGKLSGVYLNTISVLNLLTGSSPRYLPTWVSFSLCIVALFLIGIILVKFTFEYGLILTLGVLLLVFWLGVILRFMGWQFHFGNIAASSFSYLIMGNAITYTNFLALIVKAKNKMTQDPLTNLFTLRYFYENLDIIRGYLSLRKNYLAVVILEGFKLFSQGKGFTELSSIWKDIASHLLNISRIWTRYSEEVILGIIKKQKMLKRLRDNLETIFLHRKAEVKIKIGVVNVSAKGDLKTALPALIEGVKKSSDKIAFLKHLPWPTTSSEGPKVESSMASLYLDAEDKNRELLETIEKLKIEERKTHEAYVELISSLVNALESKDPYTQGHSQRVSGYAYLLANKLNLSYEEKEKIKKAGLLHDLGKIGIPDSILHKKGDLSDEDFAIIREHEVMGIKILQPVKEFQDIIPYILHHHEHFDGSGYPHGLGGELIPLGARIIAVADIFDALTTGRDYKLASSTPDALFKLNALKGTELDPALVSVFIDALKEGHITPSV